MTLEDLANLVRDGAIPLEVGMDEDAFRTESHGPRGWHGRVHAELSSFVGGRTDDASQSRPADDHRLAAQLRTVALFDRRIECVHIHMNDFPHVTTPALLV